MSTETPRTPFEVLGGAPVVRAIVETFYDVMERDEPDLARLHRLDDDGRVHRDARDRFALFLVGWLGGPQDYVARHGHPRLRMRHGHVPIGLEMRDAWMRAMRAALDTHGVIGPLRPFLEERLSALADHMRNRPG
jgi:hemoglobin